MVLSLIKIDYYTLPNANDRSLAVNKQNYSDRCWIDIQPMMPMITENKINTIFISAFSMTKWYLMTTELLNSHGLPYFISWWRVCVVHDDLLNEISCWCLHAVLKLRLSGLLCIVIGFQSKQSFVNTKQIDMGMFFMVVK